MTDQSVIQQFDHIWITSNSQFAHLNPACYKVTDDHSRKRTDAYPDGWLQLCQHCAEMHTRWSDQIAAFDNQCQRCGATELAAGVRLCNDCNETVQHRRAKKRL